MVQRGKRRGATASRDTSWRSSPLCLPAARVTAPARLQMCYSRSMTRVASRELRNDTAGVLRRVQAGEEVTITVNGQPVAVISAASPRRRRWLTKSELLQRLQTSQADAGLREDLAELAGETTDDLDMR